MEYFLNPIMRKFTQQQSVSTLSHICWEITFHMIIRKTKLITTSSLAVGTASSDGQRLGTNSSTTVTHPIRNCRGGKKSDAQEREKKVSERASILIRRGKKRNLSKTHQLASVSPFILDA